MENLNFKKVRNFQNLYEQYVIYEYPNHVYRHKTNKAREILER